VERDQGPADCIVAHRFQAFWKKELIMFGNL
jgi:hypothetical protein